MSQRPQGSILIESMRWIDSGVTLCSRERRIPARCGVTGTGLLAPLKAGRVAQNRVTAAVALEALRQLGRSAGQVFPSGNAYLRFDSRRLWRSSAWSRANSW